MGEEQETPEDMIEELIRQNEQKDSHIQKMSSALNSFTGTTKDQNIAQYQIETKELLMDLYHFYRGEYEAYDDEGNKFWAIPEDNEQIPFNEFGVSSMMEIITKYINKNTTLSFYSEERIYQILGDIGEELILFILCNYEKLGMNTYFKKTKFKVIVVTTLHMIESAYRKAIMGHTLTEINQSKIVTQTDSYGNRPPIYPSPQKTKQGLSRYLPW